MAKSIESILMSNKESVEKESNRKNNYFRRRSIQKGILDMTQFMAITERNIKMYFRDKGAVFFSLLSMIIVIGLMVFFLGDLNIEGITGILGQFPGRDSSQDKENAQMLVLAWTCAGILSINAVTVTLSAYAVMIKDKATGKLNSIYTAPVSRMVITAGYIVSAWMVSVCVCMITLAITEVYGALQGLPVFSAVKHMQLIGMIMMNSFVYASMMYLMALLVKTEGAWSGLGTVVGTLVGFLGGIYVPIGTLSEVIVKIIKCTPVIYGTAMFRNVMTEKIMGDTFEGIPDDIISEYRRTVGIDLELFRKDLSITQELLLLLFCGILLMAVSAGILKYSKKTDR